MDTTTLFFGTLPLCPDSAHCLLEVQRDTCTLDTAKAIIHRRIVKFLVFQISMPFFFQCEKKSERGMMMLVAAVCDSGCDTTTCTWDGFDRACVIFLPHTWRSIIQNVGHTRIAFRNTDRHDNGKYAHHGFLLFRASCRVPRR